MRLPFLYIALRKLFKIAFRRCFVMKEGHFILTMKPATGWTSNFTAVGSTADYIAVIALTCGWITSGPNPH